jgi:hypothetical protein
VLQRQAELAAHPIEKPQVKMAPRVIGLQLESAAKLLLRFSEHAGLELDQTEVRVEDRRAGILAEQSPSGAGRLVVIAPFELGDGKEIENVLVTGPREQGELELLTRDVVLLFLDELARPRQVHVVDSLLGRRRDGRRVVPG